MKMGDISEKWLKEIRSIAKEKSLEDIEAKKIGDLVDYDAQIENQKLGNLGEGKPQNVPMSRKTAKVGAESSEATVN